MWFLYRLAITFVFFLAAILSAVFMYIRFSQNRYVTGKEIPADKKAQVKQRYILTPLLLLGFGIYTGFFWNAPVRNVTYTFENKSSFPVTVMPEYGDDFQIQAGAVKSFESSHKEMKLNYNPGAYVQAKKIATGHWEFTNYDFYIEENRGFLIYPPESWQAINYPGLKFKAIIGPVENDFAPNINFVEEANPFRSFFTYADVAANNMREAGTKVITRGQFTTDSGMDAVRIETNTEKILQVYYLFDTGQKIFTVTCSAPLQSGSDYVAIFDNSVKTLEFLY